VIAEILSDTSDAVRAWWELEVSVRLRPLEIGDTIAALASQVESRVEEKLLSLRSLIDTENASIAASEATLRERTQTSAEDELVRGKREQSKGRFDAASAKRVEYNELSAALEALLEERCGIVSQLDGVQDSIAGARSASRDALEIALGRFTAPGMTVSIEFRAGKDRTRVTRFLRDEGFLAMQPFGHYRASRFAERCIEMASPTRIARAILTQSGAVLTEEGIDIDRDALCQAEVNLLLNHFNAFAEDEDAAVRVVNSERLNQVLQLQEQPWDDELRILMNERPVDQLSPGQRSSAMLPLIALSEKVPLIIDQPEDNLDNRMVGSTLTKILADLKENRQIIVATHNPNIVVGGDAEQVIVLDAPEARRAVVVRSGSIDDSDVIDSVLAIMEGGKEAFQAREKRYQQHLL
jgi:ABC-type thiamine transport system ATPase subunit